MINLVNISKELNEDTLQLIYQQASSALGIISKERNPDLSQSPYDETAIKLAKELLVLDSNQIISPRKTGLKKALDHYSRNLAAKQPQLYNICNNAAQKLLATKPYQKIPKIIICISAHETETRINNLLTSISKQNIDPEDISVYLFLNGPNLENQAQRLNELNLDLKLDLRIVQSLIPTGGWYWGLKNITATTAMLALNQSLQAEHHDLAMCFADADVIAFPHENFFNERLKKINRGMLIDGGTYKADPYLLKEININAGIIVEIDQSNVTIKQTLEKEFNRATKRNINTTPLQYLLLGGNSACSLMLLALMGGLPVHAKYFNDIALSSLSRSLLNKTFGELNFERFFALGLGPSKIEAMSNYVLTDGGEAMRALQKNYPLANAFMAHDPALKSPVLTAIDWTKPRELNLQRIHEEIKDMVERFMQHCLKQSKGWNPELEVAFTKYLNYLETKINEILKPNIIKFTIINSETIEIQLNTDRLYAEHKAKKPISP